MTTTLDSLEAKALGTAAGVRRRRYAALAAGWVGFVAIWYLLALWVGNDARLPSPGRVLQEVGIIFTGDPTIAGGEGGIFWPNFSASVLRVFLGFLTGVIFGTPLGFLMGRSRYWFAFLRSPVMIAGSIPGLTYAVMVLVVFGISFIGPIAAIGLISMPYIAINVAEGVGGVDRNLINMSTAFGRSEQQVFRNVVLPSVLPFIFAGIRLSFSLAWKVGQLTEVFGSSEGIGFQIRRNFQLFNMPAVIAWVGLFIAFMLILERFILVRVERRLFRWRQ
ncbi:MAG: ABC transporter permease subunit, partial [Acidimicrobiia bacterium]|nr:ABC transporter permease subunit [Acidimicrobiia bacterium]